ncbi:MAG: methylmalonyl-CoA carboxyltransferase [Chloroflexi bacterium]|nr:methylmalonyl-CoA carboxyltransferase [Chloroflexota bacterium]
MTTQPSSERWEELRKTFKTSRSMAAKLDVLSQERKLIQQGDPAAVEKLHQQGKQTARERLSKLLDRGSLQELDSWHRPYETGFPIGEENGRGDGVVVGHGLAHSCPVTVYAQDASVMDGTMGTVHARKINMVMRNALEARTPIVGIFDSPGIRAQDAIQYPAFYGTETMSWFQTTASGVIPKISLVMGPCTGEMALVAAMADFVFMVRDTSYMHLAPPPEGLTGKDIGDAWNVHARVTGVCDVFAENEDDCLQKCRDLLGLLPRNNTQKPPVVDTGDDPDASGRAEELLELAPVDSNKPYNMYKLISLIVDNGFFFEVKRYWAKNLITGLARLGGQTVGLLANNPQDRAGCMTLDAADKLSRFVRFCDAFNIPLIWLCDTPAFLPAVEEEVRGLIRHGCGVLQANTEATVPRVTVSIRKRYGGGGLAMPGQMMMGDLHVAWPTFEPGLMGAAGAVAIIYGRELKAIADEAKRKEQEKKRIAEMERGLDMLIREAVQDFIDPRDTRAYLVKALRWLGDRQQQLPERKHENFRV